MASRKKHLILENREQVMSLTRLGRQIPGGPLCYHTLRIWCVDGRRRVKDDPQSSIKLEYVSGPNSKYLSSIEAYWRLMDKFNED
jgi:hypothetical protein